MVTMLQHRISMTQNLHVQRDLNKSMECLEPVVTRTMGVAVQADKRHFLLRIGYIFMIFLFKSFRSDSAHHVGWLGSAAFSNLIILRP